MNWSQSHRLGSGTACTARTGPRATSRPEERAVTQPASRQCDDDDGPESHLAESVSPRQLPRTNQRKGLPFTDVIIPLPQNTPGLCLLFRTLFGFLPDSLLPK